MSDKKLIRPVEDVKVAGVCAAIANYFDLDVTIVRIVYAVLTVFSTGFPGIILYLVLMLVIPKAEPKQLKKATADEQQEEQKK